MNQNYKHLNLKELKEDLKRCEREIERGDFMSEEVEELKEEIKTREDKIKKELERQEEIYNFLLQQRKREEQLLSGVLKCFEENKRDTLKDLKVLKHNLILKGGLK